jgi:hypothetical protein
MSYITDKNSIIRIYLNIPLLSNSIQEYEKSELQYIYSKKIAGYTGYYFFGIHTNIIMETLINYHAETFGKDSLNNILYNLYVECAYVFDNKDGNKVKYIYK